MGRLGENERGVFGEAVVSLLEDGLRRPETVSVIRQGVRRHNIYVKKQDISRLIGFLAERQPLPEQADLMMVLGSSDLRVPLEAAKLYHIVKIGKVIVSGGIGLNKQRTILTGETEAQVYRRIMIQNGVPAEIIFTEEKSRLTGENICNSIELLRQNGNLPGSVLLVQNPTAQKRARALLDKHFPLYAPKAKLISYAAYIP